MNVKELILALAKFDPLDPIVLSTCDNEGNEIDLFDFYVDHIENCEYIDGTKFTEVRICQLPHEEQYKVQEQKRQDLTDISIQILDMLVHHDFVHDCFDTDDQTEFFVQDKIYNILEKNLIK